MYAKGENYRGEGDHGGIVSSIPPLSGTHPLPSGRDGIAEGAGRAGLFHREGQVPRQGQHPPQWATAPQCLSWEKRTGLVTITGPGKSGANMETAELRAGLAAASRIPTPQLEERSVIQR